MHGGKSTGAPKGNVIGRKPRLEKEVRAATRSACFEAGHVVLPKSAPWIADYETELLGFPSAKFDDQVDSTTQFLEWAQERTAYEVAMVPPVWGWQARLQWMQDLNPRFF
jgi:phage terminase large subunit-like protein